MLNALTEQIEEGHSTKTLLCSGFLDLHYLSLFTVMS